MLASSHFYLKLWSFHILSVSGEIAMQFRVILGCLEFKFGLCLQHFFFLFTFFFFGSMLIHFIGKEMSDTSPFLLQLTSLNDAINNCCPQFSCSGELLWVMFFPLPSIPPQHRILYSCCRCAWLLRAGWRRAVP